MPNTTIYRQPYPGPGGKGLVLPLPPGDYRQTRSCWLYIQTSDHHGAPRFDLSPAGFRPDHARVEQMTKNQRELYSMLQKKLAPIRLHAPLWFQKHTHIHRLCGPSRSGGKKTIQSGAHRRRRHHYRRPRLCGPRPQRAVWVDFPEPFRPTLHRARIPHLF